MAPDEEEAYLLAILESADGLDLAEFAWYDPETEDGCYRAWDFQWAWYTCEDTFQIDQGARATGKTVSMKMRAFAFPFNKPGQKMLLTAPELNHLRPIVDAIETQLLATRLGREMLPETKGNGMNRQPHWQVRFKNGAQIVSRLPNKDGKGVKGCNAGSHTFRSSDWPADAPDMLVPGALVLTKRGNIPIEDVVVGDEVLTHMRRWRKVTATYSYGDAPVVEVIGGGHRGLKVSETHSMWARRNRNPQRTVNLEPPTWVEPAVGYYDPDFAEFTKRWYFGSPVDLPRQDLPVMPHDDVEAVLALMGAYVADGSTRYNSNGTARGLSICDDEDDLPRLQALMRELGHDVRAYPRDGSRAVRVDVESRALCEFAVKHFGRLAAGKRIPVWLLGADERYRKTFLDAYLAGDGTYDQAKGRWTASTASKELAIGLRLLGQSLGYVCGYSWVDPKVTEVMGSTLKQPPRRSHRVTFTASGRNAVVEDGFAWQKVRNVQPAGEAPVYDLTVEEDHSYIVDGLVSHNQHVIQIELDEAQDYPLAGWIEIVETLNRGLPGAMWRCHGVSKGVRDRFFEYTEEGSGWTVHRPMAMNRPTWSKEERDEKILTYGGSRQNIDYKRNIYGEHGDASNSVFVLSRLMAAVDTDDGSIYNSEVYSKINLEFERLPDTTGMDEGEAAATRQAAIHAMLDIPGSHLTGYSQSVDRKQVGAPKGYSAFWGGADIGVTNHPSEFLICGQRAGEDVLELLLRIQMHRINTDDQKWVVEALFDFYGTRLKAFALDKTGVGFPIWDQLSRHPRFGKRIYGYNFSEKVVVGFEDRPLEGKETQADLAIERNVVEATTDWLRNDYVDGKKLRLPYDREVLLEFQGQTYTVVKDSGNPYGTRRIFSGGSFHTLDAMKMLMAGKHLPPLEEALKRTEARPPILDIFFEG